MGTPTRRCPSFDTATMDGVVLMPSEFSRTFGLLPSMVATQEFVVPRSIPMMLPALLRIAAEAVKKPLLELGVRMPVIMAFDNAIADEELVKKASACSVGA